MSTVDVVTKISVLLAFSLVMQVFSLVALGFLVADMSALLKAFMVVHYETIAKWKYGQDARESVATGGRPVAV
jgi:heme O synthase-like polyprenyltransferase